MSGGPPPLEDYALIGGGDSAALVSRAGSIDWLCWPRFDSPACFAALLGTAAQGAWRVAPVEPGAPASRRYVGDSMVLETMFATESGAVTLTDFMPEGLDSPALIRLIDGRRGRVAMRMAMALRFGYGAVPPMVQPVAGGVAAIAGPDLAVLRADIALAAAGADIAADFVVAAGERVALVLQYGPSHLPPPPALAAKQCLAETLRASGDWSARTSYRGRYGAAVRRSLLTLRALIHRPTGGMVAAPTTSLPEQPGGTRNWDYRYVWLRDSALTVRALLRAGHAAEALAWRDWLRRAIGGDPARARIMYGLAGEPHLPEWQADWLPGYQGARPVRVGNAAHDQRQWDVFGEVLDALSLLGAPGESWALQAGLIGHLEAVWQWPDEGIWETRGGRRRFTFSAVMAWVAFDRAIATAERFGLPAPLARWRAVRADIHAAVCREGFDSARNCFVQSFGGSDLDASALLIPLVGFLPPDDPRVLGTVSAIEQALLADGFVRRYRTESGSDGLPPGEGAFLACSFWLVECYARQGRMDEAVALFERLLTCCNDVGLLAEEYDPAARRLLGNFPQAFSHLALVGAALALQ